MSAEKIDMSLDDIIQLGRGRGRGRGGGRGGSMRSGRRGMSGFRGRGRGGRGGRAARFGFNRQAGGRVIRGGVQKRRGFRRPAFTKNLQQAGNVYTGFQQRANFASSNGTNKYGKLLISNLDFGVNDADIKELFAEFGVMRKAAVHYDKSGRSLGTAEVIYTMRNPAINAMKQYNNVPLDGRPMQIQLIGGAPSSSAVTARTSFSTRGAAGRAFGGRGRRGFGRGAARGGRGGRGRGSQKLPSRDELDAQLDAYNAKMDTN